MYLYCDLETRSLTDIKYGTHRYAEDPQAEILLWGYAIDNAPAKVWDATAEPIPSDLLSAIRTVQNDPESRHIWHNGINFDTVFIEKNYPDLAMPLDRIIDTMVLAYQHALPGALGDLSVVCHLPQDKAKDRDGHRLVRLFCCPDPVTKEFRTRDGREQDWARFVNYCRLDVEAERALFEKMPKFNVTEDERKLMLLDAEINRYGMLVDVDLANGAIEAIDRASTEMLQRTNTLTDGELDSTTRGTALRNFIADKYGLDLPNLRKNELSNLLEQPDMPEPVRELLRIRLASAKSSVKKFEAIANSVCSDNRLRGCLQFRGAARTGRFSGRLFQPQNLTRPSMSDEAIELAIEATKGGYLDILTDNIGETLSNCLRGSIIVPQGSRMVVADFSNIEGRVLAWEADELWKLKAFKEYDVILDVNGNPVYPHERLAKQKVIKLDKKGEPIHVGHDLYKLTYANTFNIKPTDVTKSQRQMGKVLELAMGYGGGVGAFVTFARGFNINLETMADAVIPVIPEETLESSIRAYEWAKSVDKLNGLSHDVWIACDSIKRLWRAANSNIVKLWQDVDDAAIKALENPGVKCAVNDKLYFIRRGQWLLLRLPSGRFLCYPGAKKGTEEEQCTFTYYGTHQLSRKWMKLKTYAGKLVENATQAIAADILTTSLLNAKAAGFQPILTVHDEILTEAPDDEAHNEWALQAAMEILPAWADESLPLSAAGFTAYRYRK